MTRVKSDSGPSLRSATSHSCCTALATHIEAKIRARHEQDPILASIAATTTPIDDVAQELIDMIDAHGWALLINAEIQPPGPAMPTAAPAAQPDDAQNDDDDRNDDEDPDEPDEDNDGDERDQLTDVPVELARMMPTHPAAYQRWRGLWVEISERPDATNKQLADDLTTSVRTVQRIRAVGAAGLLDSPQTPTGRLLRHASTNGVSHPQYTS